MKKITSNRNSLRIAVELPKKSPPGIEYIRYDSKCPDQHWGTTETVAMTLSVAKKWTQNDNSPILLIGDISARNFTQTGCHEQHKKGTHVDFDLENCLPKDKGFDRGKCETLCKYMIEFGTKRVLLNDAQVKKVVNAWAVANKLIGRVDDSVPGHDDHFHAEMPLGTNKKSKLK